MKTCIRCKETKGTEYFGRNAACPDGVHYYCRSCQSDACKVHKKKWRKENPGYSKAWRQRNHQTAKEKDRRHRLRHREKRAAQARAWREANADRVKAYRAATAKAKYQKEKARLMADPVARRKRSLQFYGFTYEQFTELLTEQGNRCGICKVEMPVPVRGKNRSWHTDHDHVTGLIRGILCANCNRGLGCFKDNPEFLQAAIAYLASSQPNVSEAA